jgi:hypothetical protein
MYFRVRLPLAKYNMQENSVYKAVLRCSSRSIRYAVNSKRSTVNGESDYLLSIEARPSTLRPFTLCSLPSATNEVRH